MSTAWQLLFTFTFSRSLSLFAWQQHGNRLETASQHGNCIATALSHFHFLTFASTFCMATAWQQVGNCFSLSLSDVHFHFLHGNSMATAWKVLLTFTFSLLLSLFCMATATFLKMYFSKCILQIKMYFSKCISQNVFLKTYFTKCVSQNVFINVFLKMHFCFSVFLKMYF